MAEMKHWLIAAAAHLERSPVGDADARVLVLRRLRGDLRGRAVGRRAAAEQQSDQILTRTLWRAESVMRAGVHKGRGREQEGKEKKVRDREKEEDSSEGKR